MVVWQVGFNWNWVYDLVEMVAWRERNVPGIVNVDNEVRKRVSVVYVNLKPSNEDRLEIVEVENIVFVGM